MGQFSKQVYASKCSLLCSSNLVISLSHMWEPKIRHERTKKTSYGQLVVSIPRLSAPSRHLQGKIHALGTFFSTSVISFMVSHFDYKHRCHVEKNVPIALILPSRWQNGTESQGIERTSCLCLFFRPWLIGFCDVTSSFLKDAYRNDGFSVYSIISRTYYQI